MTETSLVKYKDNKIDTKIETLLEQTITLTDADFYKVAGKTVLSARALQWDANRKHISTKIIDWGSDNKRAFAIVAGWVGDEAHPKQYKEAIVEIDFDVIRSSFVLDKAKIGWPIQRDDFDGKPAFKKEEHKAEMFSYMLRKKQFSVRECVTKCEAIVNRKLLSMEFREEVEIESEKDEINAVRESKALQQSRRTSTYGIDNKNGTVYKEQPKEVVIDNTKDKGCETKVIIDNKEYDLKAYIHGTEKEKRDWITKVYNDKDDQLHDKVIKLLNNRNIGDLDEKAMDGILMIIKMETE